MGATQCARAQLVPSAQNLPRSIDRQLIVRGLVMNVNAVGSRDLIGFRFLFIDIRPLFFPYELFPSFELNVDRQQLFKFGERECGLHIKTRSLYRRIRPS